VIPTTGLVADPAVRLERSTKIPLNRLPNTLSLALITPPARFTVEGRLVVGTLNVSKLGHTEQKSETRKTLPPETPDDPPVSELPLRSWRRAPEPVLERTPPWPTNIGEQQGLVNAVLEEEMLLPAVPIPLFVATRSGASPSSSFEGFEVPFERRTETNAEPVTVEDWKLNSGFVSLVGDFVSTLPSPMKRPARLFGALMVECVASRSEPARVRLPT
jgi:hypothetical protein